MPEPLAILKMFSGVFSWAFKFVSKYFDTPELELDVQALTREREGEVLCRADVALQVPVYQYVIRVNNRSDYRAHHVELISCNYPHHFQNLDYFAPIHAHTSTTFTLSFADEVVQDLNALYPEMLILPGGLIGTGPDTPPLTELRIEYANSKGKKFFTVFRPVEDREHQNKLGAVVVV